MDIGKDLQSSKQLFEVALALSPHGLDISATHDLHRRTARSHFARPTGNGERTQTVRLHDGATGSDLIKFVGGVPRLPNHWN